MEGGSCVKLVSGWYCINNRRRFKESCLDLYNTHTDFMSWHNNKHRWFNNIPNEMVSAISSPAKDK